MVQTIRRHRLKLQQSLFPSLPLSFYRVDYFNLNEIYLRFHFILHHVVYRLLEIGKKPFIVFACNARDMINKKAHILMRKITDKIVTTINLNKQENPPKLIV